MTISSQSRDEVGSCTRSRFLSRVRIRNYKSVDKCDVELGSLTILVGRNGAGKSNILDAIRFVKEGLETSLDHAIKSRGGVDEVRRRSTGHPRNFAIQLDLQLSDWSTATFGFEIGSQSGGGFTVKREQLKVIAANNRTAASYQVRQGEVADSTVKDMPPATRDRLFLVNAAGRSEFRPVYDALLAMGFYNLNPAAMKELQSPDAGELLQRDGVNIASVVGRLESDEPVLRKRINEYLERIAPGIVDVHRVGLGPRETLQFRQEVAGSKYPWGFYAASMSDGTLRALGTLVAVMQLADRKNTVRLVGIEEPETALHPAAAGTLMDALRDAVCHTQVIITSHSPDLLDELDPEFDTLLAVQASQGNSEVGPVDKASWEALRQHLFSAGELLRMDQLQIDPAHLDRQQQMELFSESEEE